MTMRISTSSLYSTATTQLGTLQSQMAHTQQQVASNKRMLSAADDPVAAARALEVTQSQSINAQFATNRQNGRSALSQEEVALNSVADLIANVQEISVAAANGTNSATDRATYANEVQSRLDDLISLANISDGNGSYLFGGYKSGVKPFAETNTGVQYVGDQGQVQLQVGSARKVAINDAGSVVFGGGATGNGVFMTTGGGANSGSGVISAGAVSDPSQLTGHSYQLDFDPAGTNYIVTDTTTGTSAPPVAYTSGAPIVVAGMRFDIQGVPGGSDQFKVQPSDKQTLFATLSNLVATLRAPANTTAEKQALSAGLGQAAGNLNASLDNVLSVRSSVGSRQKELDDLDDAGSSIDLQYTATLSGLQDLDLVKAYSLLAQQQFTLEAAQKSFKSMSSLSLFNFIT
jgi:flagellar hook-associated protein 3 FlgL